MIDLALIKDRLSKEVLNADYPDEIRAVLLYQLGQAMELTQGGGTAEAMRHYLLTLKSEDDFQLGAPAAGSILLGTGSHERLVKLYQMALGRSRDRFRAAISLFLAEHLDAAPVEGLDRPGLLAGVTTGRPEAVVALAMAEWDDLRSGDRAALARTLEAWLATEAHPIVAATLDLDLAGIRIEEGDNASALAALRAALASGTAPFPTFCEAYRLATRTGDAKAAARLALGEARRMLDGSGDVDPDAHFLIATPGDRIGAAAVLLTMAVQACSAGRDSSGDPEISAEVDAVLSGMDPAAIVRTGLAGIALDHFLATGKTEALDRLLAASGEEPIEKAWNLWSRARVALVAGRFDEVREHVAGIRSAGYRSPVLDAIDALASAVTDPTGAAGGNPMSTLVAQEASWVAGGGDAGTLARAIAGWESLDRGLADLAWVAARLSGDTFLRQRSDEAWIEAGGPLADVAILDLVRLHGFERPSRSDLEAALGRADRASADASAAAVLLAAGKLAPGGRAAAVLPRIADLASRVTGSAADAPGTMRLAGSVDPGSFGGAAEGPVPGSWGPLEIRSLLRGSSSPGGAPGAATWLASAARPGQGLDPTVAGAAAAMALGRLDGQGSRDLATLLLDPAVEVDPAVRLRAAIELGDRDRMVAALEEFAGELPGGPAQAAVVLVGALRRFLSDGDAAAAIDAVAAAVDAAPESPEAVYALLFVAMSAGRWQEAGRALDILLEDGRGDDQWTVAWRRSRMILTIAAGGSRDRAAEQATAMLAARGGDAVSLIVRLAALRAAGDLDGYVRDLGRLALWFGDPKVKGSLAHHIVQLSAIREGVPEAPPDEDALPPPDPAVLSPYVAMAVLNGPVDLTEAGLEAAVAEARALSSVPFRVRALVELADLVDAAGQPRRALDLYLEALAADRLEPGAIEGILRVAPRLEDHVACGRALEARVDYVPDPQRAADLLVKAAESFGKAPGSEERAASCWHRAAMLDPGNPRSFTGLMKALELRGDLKGLIDLVERRVASVLEPEEIEALQLKLADLKRQVGDLEGALVAVDDLLLVQPGKVTAWKLKLDILFQQERYKEGLDAADQLVGKLAKKESRLAVLNKCINVSLGKTKDLERGLGYCLKLIGEGGGDEDLVNKTLRLALRLEKWNDAAALQETLASRAATPRERQALLYKKAEIHLRYAKAPAAAEDVYRSILDEDPLAWEALLRWNAARGAQGLSAAEMAQYVERVLVVLEQDPFRPEGHAFLVKAHRTARNAAAARYYDTIGRILAGTTDEASTQARISLAPGGPALPRGGLVPMERDDLLGVGGDGTLVQGVLSNLCDGGALDVLAADGALPPEDRGEPLPQGSPFARQLEAWGRTLGVPMLSLASGQCAGEGVRIGRGGGLIVDPSIAHQAPDEALFRAGVLLGWLGIGVPVMALLDRARVVELVKAGLMASGGRVRDLEAADGTRELGERMANACTAGCMSRISGLVELAASVDAAAIRRGVASLEAGAAKAGILVSLSVPGLIAWRRPGMLDRPLGAAEVKEFFDADAVLGAGLRFALSPKLVRIRKELDLDSP